MIENSARLSRRERQIMDVIYARGPATVGDVLEDLPDPPSRTSVRTLVRILEEKGHLKHRERGREYVYTATRPRRREGQSALRRVLSTFFDGSLQKALAAHMSDPNAEISEEELTQLTRLLRDARKRGR